MTDPLIISTRPTQTERGRGEKERGKREKEWESRRGRVGEERERGIKWEVREGERKRWKVVREIFRGSERKKR